MRDQDKSKEQLLDELSKLRQQIAESKRLETEHRRTEQALSLRSRQLETLFNVSNILVQPGNFAERATRVLDELAQAISADIVVLRLLDEETGELQPAAWIGFEPDEKLPALVTRLGKSLAGQAFEQGGAVVVNDYESYPDAYPDRLAQGIKSAVSLPVKIGDNLLGTVTINSREPNHFTSQRIRLLTAVGDGMGVLLEKVKLIEAVRESEERFRRLVEGASDAFFVSDREGKFIDVNQRACEMLGYSCDELLRLSVPDIDAEFDLERFSRSWDRLVAGDQVTVETVLKRNDGATLPAEIRVGLIELDGSQYRFSLIRDITERKRVEQELVRLERLRALEDMAAGISHSLNNLLTGILVPAQLVQRRTNNPQVLNDIETILNSGWRARDLVQRLHQATQFEDGGEKQPVSVNDALQDVIRETRPQWKEGPREKGILISVTTHLEHVPPIQGTEDGLREVLVNLLLNAVDAMPQGGTITIHTQLVETDVQISVSDTGVGMDEDTRMRAFEPFFTTKADVGSGLGLSTANNIVTRWGGEIQVDSEPGKGSTFTLRFPVENVPETD